MKLLIVIGIVLYSLIYFVRFQQGGWEIQIDLFKEQRAVLDERIQIYLSSPHSELLSGILLGQNKELPPQTRLSLRDTSTLHIVVASGQNLSILAAFFLYLSGLITRRVANILSLLAIIFYILLTGAQVPVLRAGIMVFLSFLAQAFGREKMSAWILVVTAGLMLLANPTWISDLSFQLSFLATFGVVVISPIFLKYLQRLPLLGSDLAVTLGAQLMVTPIIAQNFHQFSLVGLLTNILVLWTIPFIMIIGSLMLVFSILVEPIAKLFSWAVGALLSYFIFIVQFFASLPFAWEYVPELNWLVWIGYYLIVAGILKFIHDHYSARRKASRELI